MLLTNRRHRMLFLCLSAMDVAWFLPFAMLLAAYYQAHAAPMSLGPLSTLLNHPLSGFLLLWSTMIVYMFAADALNRRETDTPWREVIVFVLLASTGLASVRFVVYPHVAVTDWHWLVNTAAAVFNFTDGLRAELILLLVNAFLWWRVAVFTDREN